MTKNNVVLKKSSQMIFQEALESGIIKRAECSKCGYCLTVPYTIDKDKPLEVEWLCYLHMSEKCGVKINFGRVVDK